MRQVAVSRRAAIAALVLPALVLAAMAARSYQPFAGEPGDERAGSTIFLDSTFTIALVFAGALLMLLVWMQVWMRIRPKKGPRDDPALLLSVLFLGFFVFVGYHGLLQLDRPRPSARGTDVAFPAARFSRGSRSRSKSATGTPESYGHSPPLSPA